MKGEVIAEDGSGVKYSELKSSSLFQQYKAQAAELQHLDLSTLSEKEKMAFFISILWKEQGMYDSMGFYYSITFILVG